jgi:hypothetical protein
VEFLAVAAGFHAVHEDVFGSHEGEFGLEALVDDGLVDDKTARDVDEDVEDGVGGEEGFGDDDAFVGGIVEGAFEDLLGGGCSGLPTRFMRKRERPVTRSVRTGLRL